jgi:hypothetical protein
MVKISLNQHHQLVDANESITKYRSRLSADWSQFEREWDALTLERKLDCVALVKGGDLVSLLRKMGSSLLEPEEDELEIASFSTSVEQDCGYDEARELRHVRMIDVTTDGAQLLELSRRFWVRMIPTEKRAFNAWVERYHNLKVEWAEQRLEVRERIEEIMSDACDHDDLDSIETAIKTARAESAAREAA